VHVRVFPTPAPYAGASFERMQLPLPVGQRSACFGVAVLHWNQGSAHGTDSGTLHN